jgi:hypothetical protein
MAAGNRRARAVAVLTALFAVLRLRWPCRSQRTAMPLPMKAQLAVMYSR